MKLLFFFFILSLNYIPLTGSSFSENGIEPWGSDSQLLHPLQEKTQVSLSKGQAACQGMIRFFQNYISPIDGPRSSFYPTSSQYALDAIRMHGVFKGIAMGCDRLMRENRDWWIYETTPNYGFDRKIDPVRRDRGHN